MSMSYWVIEGVGVDTEKLEPFLDNEKLCSLFLEQFPTDEFLLDIAERKAFHELDYHDFLYGEPFDGLADIFTHCDDTDSICYGCDGESGDYFYYPPSMPWERSENEPETLEEVHRRIINAVVRLTTLAPHEINEMINDDLYVPGCG